MTMKPSLALINHRREGLPPVMDVWRSIEFSGAACDWFPATDFVVVLCGDMSLSPCQGTPSFEVFFTVTWPVRGPELGGTNRLERPPKKRSYSGPL